MLFVILAGCGGSYRDFGVDQPQIQPVPPAPSASAATTESKRIAPLPPVETIDTPAPVHAIGLLTKIEGGSTLVILGETLFAISRRTGVSVADLAGYNSLELPYIVKTGQRLHWPTLRYHQVAAGETALSISRLYGLQLVDLTDANGLTPPYVVRIGQTLRLPDENVTVAEPSLTSPPKIVAKPALDPTVQPPAPRVAALPPGTPAAPAAAVAPPPSPAPAVTPPASPAPAVTAPAPRFQWPVEGRLLSGYGDKGNGRFNDGLNIATQRGQAIRAAADGLVAYAGDVRGFGKTLLIRHGTTWLSVYAHADELLVARGAQVKRGEVIARAGQSGDVTSPQLHFEIRKGSHAVDPTLHLPERK